MIYARRIGLLLALCLGVAVFRFGPEILRLDTQGLILWTAAFQLGGPLAATVASALAARRGAADDAVAWTAFAIGSALYCAGNLAFVFLSLDGTPPAFPSLPEAAYYLMAIIFAFGMSRYGQIARRTNRLQVYNFALIYGAVSFGCLFLLRDALAASRLGALGSLAAFAYPTLWSSVAAFGVVSLLLFNQRDRAFPFVLLVLAVMCEAGADFRYALEQMAGTYQIGSPTQVLWIASSGLICCAAIEEMSLAVRSKHLVAERRRDRAIAQAMVPAIAISVILVAASLSGAFGTGIYQFASGVLAAGFALFVGLRELHIITTQRTLRLEAEVGAAQVAHSEHRLTSVLHSTSDNVLVLDRDWRIEFFNDHAVEAIPELATVRLGGLLWDALRPGEREQFESFLTGAVQAQQPLELETYNEARGMWVEIRLYPTADGLSIFFRDVSESRRAREELRYQARHDLLTGLGNRALFQERLNAVLATGQAVAVLLVDLDDFKGINDTLGHPVGDLLLTAAAGRLTGAVGPTDCVARLGGDEFAIVVAGARVVQVEAIAYDVLAAIAAPLHREGRQIRIHATIGIATAEPGVGHADELLKMADIALYAAKDEGRGEFRRFAPRMQRQLEERQSLRTDLAAALDLDQFELAYQPLVDLKTGAVSCFEALLRWRHPTRGIVGPDQFIPVAEETGLIVPIGAWVLQQACREARAWPSPIALAVNLSTRQFSGGNLPEMVSDALLATGFDVNRLELEITESALLQDSVANLAALKELQAMGVSVALDDFGAGYSALGYLQKFRFSKLKIDRSFIAGLPDNHDSKAIVAAIVGLGRSLGIRVTAEGVETAAQYEWVRESCDEAQGFLLSRPVPAAEIPAVLSRLGADRQLRLALG